MIAVLVIAGGGPILIVRSINQARYRRRTEEVLAFAESSGYQFLGSTVNNLGTLKELAPGYQPDAASASGRRAKTLAEDMRLYRIIEGYKEETNLPWGNKEWVHNLFVIPRGSGAQHVFDYVYRHIIRGEGTSRTTEYRHTVAAFTSDQLTLPWFGLVPAPQAIAGGAAEGLAFDDHPVFSRTYRLYGEDEEAIRGLFGPEIIAFFENHEGLRVHGNGNRFIVFQAEPGYLRANRMDSHITTANAIFSEFADQQ